MADATRKIVIDTDPGHDDALALLLVVKSGLFDIQAVTTVAGNSSLQNITNNARYILDLAGSNAPLYSGASSPLKRDLVQAEVHGENGLAGAVITKQEPLTHNAHEKIIEIVRAHPHEITLITLGPLTNVAKAFLEDPELPSLLQEVVIMGGAIAVPGNKNRVGEFNVFVDPDAADIVFEADVKKTLIPLDACNDISLSLEEFEMLKGSSLYEPVLAMMKPYIQGIRTFEKTSGALMYDPLAAYYAINPLAYTIEPMDVHVETKGEYTLGMTVADRRTWGEKKNNINVATHIDRDAFVKDFFKYLCN